MNGFKFLLAFTLFIACNASFLDNFKKCSANEETCVNTLFQNMIEHTSKTGMPEHSIPVLDPFQMENFKLKMLDSIEITFNGIVKGLSKCQYKRNRISFDKLLNDQTLICDAIIKGNFTFAGSNPILQTLIGSNDISNEGGEMEFKLDKLKLNMHIPFTLDKKDNGDIFINLVEHNPDYDYDLNDMKLSAKDVRIGGQNYGEIMTSYFNENWRFILKNFGKPIMDQLVGIYLSFVHKFCAAVPTNEIFEEDLSIYL